MNRPVSEFVEMPPTVSTPAGIYVHIPFCRRKCRYCNFYSVSDPSLYGRFVDGLLFDIKSRRQPVSSADTLYLGGGTPSVLPVEMIERILDAVHRHVDMAADCEITMEINPGTASTATLSAYRRLGVNRLNIGAQSFDDAVLGFLGRMHSADDARRAIQSARQAGFDNIGIDLMFGLPGQSGDAWFSDLSEAAAFETEHLSVYQLTFEAHTPLTQALEAGRFDPPPESLMADLYGMTADVLGERGFRQYEVSNYAWSRRFRSRHNAKYWNFVEYVGFGPAAHSFFPPQRSWNDPDLTGYLHALETGNPPPGGCEVLTTEQLQIEAIYLGLRQSAGIDTDRFEAMFSLPFAERFAPLIEELTEGGYLALGAGRCTLTRKGMLLADRIAAAFVTWEPGQKAVEGVGYVI